MRLLRSYGVLLGAIFLCGALLLPWPGVIRAGHPPVERSAPHVPVVDVGEADVAAAAGENVDLIGVPRDHARGAVYAVTSAGGYAYIGAGIHFVVLDVTSPMTPTFMASLPIFAHARAIAIQNEYAYVAAWSDGLFVIDISDPSRPLLVTRYHSIADVRDVAVDGMYAYVASHWDGLRILNIANPAQPVEAGSISNEGPAFGVAVAGNYAYLANGLADLRVIDVSNPATPQEVSVFQSPGQAKQVYLSGNFAYLADGIGGLRVVNISNPLSPVDAGSYDTSGSADDVEVVGSLAYLTDGLGVRIVDVSNPAQPAELSFLDPPGPEFALSVVNGHLLVASAQAGLQVLDATDPAQPALVTTVAGIIDPHNIAVDGNYAFVAEGAAGLRVVDVSTPATPHQAALYDTTGEVYAVSLDENYLYLADGDSGLRILDRSNPLQLQEVGLTDTPGWAMGLYRSDDYVYVADGPGGLRIVNISNPAAPVESGHLVFLNDHVRSVAVSGSFAYVTLVIGGLRVMDVSNESQPVVVGGLSLPQDAASIAIGGNFAYVAAGFHGIRVIDISNPAQPVEIASLETPGHANAVSVEGNLLYVAHAFGVEVVDIGVPAQPVVVGHYANPYDSVAGVVKAGEYLYAAEGGNGLVILRYHPYTFPAAGQILNWDNTPLAGIEVGVSPTRTATTDSQGRFTLSGLLTGTYTLTPNTAGYVYEPASYTVNVPPLARGLNFTVSNAAVYQIGGAIFAVEAPNPTLFAQPVQLQLSNGQQTSSQNGLYNFANLPPGQYVVTPTLQGVSFYPPNQTLAIPPSTGSANFTVVSDPSLNIQGTLHQMNGLPFAGLSVQLSAPAGQRASLPHTVTTDSQGRYAFLNLEPGSYSLSISGDAYRFLPASRTVELPTVNSYPFVILPAPATTGPTDATTTTLVMTDTQGLTTTLVIPAGALDAQSALTVTPFFLPQFPGHVSAHHALLLEVSPSASRVQASSFAQAVTLSLRYSQADTRSVSALNSLALWWQDAGVWRPAQESCPLAQAQQHDEAARLLTVAICQTGRYALFGATEQLFAPLLQR